MSGLTIDEDLKKRNMKIVLNHSGPFPNMSWTGLSSAANWIKRHLHVSTALPNNIVNAMQSVFVGREDDTYITQ